MLKVHRVVGDIASVFSDSPLTPLSKACLGLAGLLAALLIAVVVNYVAHGGTEGLNPVAEAAAKTAAIPGGRLKVTVVDSVSGSPKKVTGAGGGIFDTASGRAHLALVMESSGRVVEHVVTVSDRKTVFTRSSGFESHLLAGKEWLSMQPLLGHDLATANGSQPNAEGALELLASTGADVERVGEETVRGVGTTRYKGTVRLAAVASHYAATGEATLAREYRRLAEREPGPIPVEVWIDDSGLLREWRIVESVPTGNGKTLTEDIRTELFDLAAHPGIGLPPADRVLDYTPVLRAELGMMDGSNLALPSPPPGKAPLSVAAFQRRATASCRLARAQVLRQMPRVPEFVDRLKALGPDELRVGGADPILHEMGLWMERSVYPLGIQQISRLSVLAPPARFAADYRRYLATYGEVLEWGLAEARAFQVGIAGIPNTDRKAEARVRQAKLRRLTAAMGIQACEIELTSDVEAEPV